MGERRTAFVLGGGGLLGAGEVGMLRALLEAGIVPDLVVGTSVGAINGAAVAADPTPEAIDNLSAVWHGLAESDLYGGGAVRRARHFARTRTSVHPNEPLRDLLLERLGDRDIEDLPVPFQCVAASIERAAEQLTLDQQVTSGNGLAFTNLAGGPEAAAPFTAFGPGAFSVTFKDLSNKVVGASSVIPYSVSYSATRDSSTQIHTGALANQQVAIDIPDMRASALGYSAGLVTTGLATLQSLTNGKALSTGRAQDALKVIDAAINEVAATRGHLGAIQSNSIETTLDSLRLAIENLTGSESQLRDTDFALESANFSKQNILQQAATAMLAQANQVPQTVLKLLQQ